MCIRFANQDNLRFFFYIYFFWSFVYGNFNFRKTRDLVISITDGPNLGTGDAGATATNDR